MFRRKTPLATVALVASWLSIAEAQAPAATVPSGAPLTIDQAVREALDRNQGEIARAQLQQAQLRARVQAAETDIASELTTAYAEYAAAHDIVDTIEAQMLVQAQDVRTTTEYSYRRGEATFIELLDAVRASTTRCRATTRPAPRMREACMPLMPSQAR